MATGFQPGKVQRPACPWWNWTTLHNVFIWLELRTSLEVVLDNRDYFDVGQVGFLFSLGTELILLILSMSDIKEWIGNMILLVPWTSVVFHHSSFISFLIQSFLKRQSQKNNIGEFILQLPGYLNSLFCPHILHHLLEAIYRSHKEFELK